MDPLYTSAALEEGNVVAGIASVDAIIVTNTDVAAFFQIFDSATLPIDTTVPLVSIAIPASTSVTFDPEGLRTRFSAGIAFCLSSTCATKTVVGDVGFFTVLGQ
jgi:hypothetical protein